MIDVKKYKLSQDIIIFGSGSVAAQCIKFLRSKVNSKIHVFEKKQNKISVLKQQIKPLKDVIYYEINKDIKNILLNINSKIIFSISNLYIFDEDIINSHLIINYHNSLLPKHPGRYAEAWAIFCEEEKTGITWHLVTPNVDKGDIIIQKEILLNETYTAISLLLQQSRLAIETFKEIIFAFLSEKEIITFKQEYYDNIQFHHSYDIPNGGILGTNWNFHKISSFVRAMDYGPLYMLGIPKIKCAGEFYTWEKYTISTKNKPMIYSQCRVEKKENKIIISCQNNIISLLYIKNLKEM